MQNQTIFGRKRLLQLLSIALVGVSVGVLVVSSVHAVNLRIPVRWGGLPTTRDIDIADGVNREEAIEIATTYFRLYFGGCGGISEPTPSAGGWYFVPHVGYAGTPRGRLFVEADDGGIRAWSRCSSFDEANDPEFSACPSFDSFEGFIDIGLNMGAIARLQLGLNRFVTGTLTDTPR